jgi:alpha-L-fucosidase 2
MPRFSTCICVFVLILASVVTLAAAEEAYFHGSISRTPAKHWEDGFVSGNGRMGVILFGEPGDETLVANHCRLFLPLGNREIVPDLARHVPELRRTIREKGYDAAMGFFLGKAKEQGYPGIIPTDPFHPGLFVRIRQKTDGPVTDYERSEDFQTGEIVVRWHDRRGQFQRRLFVSRIDNLIAAELSGPAAAELTFPAVEQKLIHSQRECLAEWATYHNVYLKGKGGFDAAVRIIRRNQGRNIFLLIRIVPWKTPLPKEHSEAWAYSAENPEFRRPGVFQPVPALGDSSVVAYRADDDAKDLLPQLKQSLADVKDNYATLLTPHAKAHGQLFNRVTLDLCGNADRRKPTEELLDIARREKRLPVALMEKMFDAGRYMFICSAGEMMPNLQGIWTSSWTPAWSGDFTLDTNTQAAMTSACSTNLLDLMEGYFRRIEGFYPEWRINARRIYGCRGYFSNARASNTCLLLHWGGWEGVFWTSGSGWLASFFTDYAAYTGDREFLVSRCVPLLKEIAAFYEDFLTDSDKDGHVVFIPSYNPETCCGMNATMDIAVTREVLTKLIAACRELTIEQEKIARWEALLAKLPPYPISAQGELAEWPGGGVSAGHRHHSQLYPCFQSLDPLLEAQPDLWKAAQASVRTKIAGSDGGGEQSSFGRVQCGASAAFLGMAEEAYGRLEVMAVKRSMNTSLITSHEPNADIFNTDGNGGIPHTVAMMLVQTRPGKQLLLLPALPSAWHDGRVAGLRARGNLTVDLRWKDGKVMSYRIASSTPAPVRVRVNGLWKMVVPDQI